MDFCSVYIIRNTLNNKVYIGQTWLPLKQRFGLHKQKARKGCIKLHNALNKYGRDNFYIEELYCCLTQQMADEMEISYIKIYNSIENGYNIRTGGSRGKLPEESKKRISLANKGNKYASGYKRSDDFKKHLSEIKSGERHYNARLTWNIVENIRSEYKANNITQKKLAIKYNIDESCICLIINNKRWKI